MIYLFSSLHAEWNGRMTDSQKVNFKAWGSTVSTISLIDLALGSPIFFLFCCCKVSFVWFERCLHTLTIKPGSQHMPPLPPYAETLPVWLVVRTEDVSIQSGDFTRSYTENRICHFCGPYQPSQSESQTPRPSSRGKQIAYYFPHSTVIQSCLH